MPGRPPPPGAFTPRGSNKGTRLLKFLANRLVDHPVVGPGGVRGDAVDAAKQTYQSTVGPFANFARNPSVASGIGAAVALPLGGRGGAILPRLAKAADAPQLIGPSRNVQKEIMKAFPKLGDKTRHGRTYVVNLPRVENTLNGQEAQRIIGIQNTRTGNIFLGAGGAHHGTLQAEVERRGIKGPWIQHEVFAPVSDPGIRDIPTRINFDVWGKNAGALADGGSRGSAMRFSGVGEDTRAATIARMRFIRGLHKAGIRTSPAETNYGRW